MAPTFPELLSSFVEKLKEPLLPTHLVNWLLSVILLGCLANSWGKINDEDVCGFNKDVSNCHQAFGFTAVCFLVATVCVIIEFQWERLSNYHRWIYLSEFIISLVFSLAFFGFFIRLTMAWGDSNSDLKHAVGHGNPQTSIAMLFFSIISWGALAFFSYKGYKEDDIGVGGMERLGTYTDPVLFAYHSGTGSGGGGGGGGGIVSGGAYQSEDDPPIP
jgi:hypothetical protein